MKSRTKPALRAVPAAHVQLSLNVQGVLRDVQQAFYGLCVDAGKQVLAAMMEADRVALCGANNVPDARRKAVRGGTTRSSVVLGGQRIAIAMPRARSLQHGELALPTFAWAADTDPLDMATLASLAAGVSTRRYAGTLDKLPEPDEPLSVSKSSVSRRWVALSQVQLHEWLSGSIKQLDLPVVMIDGIHFRDRVILVALGIDAKGNKHVLGLREGSTEASRVVRSLLSELVDRGLDADRARLWVIDGGKALRKAHRRVLRRPGPDPALPGAQATQRDRAPAAGTARQRRPRHARCLGWRQRRVGQEATAAAGGFVERQAPGAAASCARGWRTPLDTKQPFMLLESLP